MKNKLITNKVFQSNVLQFDKHTNLIEKKQNHLKLLQEEIRLSEEALRITDNSIEELIDQIEMEGVGEPLQFPLIIFFDQDHPWRAFVVTYHEDCDSYIFKIVDAINLNEH